MTARLRRNRLRGQGDASSESNHQSARPSALSLRKKIVFATLTLVVFLLFLEGVARIVERFRPPLVVDVGQGFLPTSRVFGPSPDLGVMRTYRSKTQAFVDQTFRAVKPPGTLRVVVIGESSVFFLDDELRKLGEGLKAHLGGAVRSVDVINCGGLSYGSQRLVTVAAEMTRYQPDLFIFYLGNNEFEEMEQLELAGLNSLLAQRVVSRFAILRVVQDVFTRREIAKLRSAHNRRILASDRPNYARAWRHSITREETDQRMQSFEKNLGLMFQIAKKSGAAAMIGTIPSNVFSPYLPKEDVDNFVAGFMPLMKRGDFASARTFGDSVIERSLGRRQSSTRENAIIRRAAATWNIPLVNVEDAVARAEPHGIPGETLFEDHCHLNSAGRQVWLDAMLAATKTIGLDTRRAYQSPHP